MGDACARAAGWLLVGVPVGAVVVTLPTSLFLLAFGLGLFVFPTVAAGVVLLRRGRAARVAGGAVAAAMAALLAHATTWASDLVHAWFYWPLLGYAALTGALGLGAAVLLHPVERRRSAAVVAAAAVLTLGSVLWVATGSS